jgi:hypothetical protein
MSVIQIQFWARTGIRPCPYHSSRFAPHDKLYLTIVIAQRGRYEAMSPLTLDGNGTDISAI